MQGNVAVACVHERIPGAAHHIAVQRDYIGPVADRGAQSLLRPARERAVD